jgi:methionine synthase I (cobalamin-dependent)
MASQIILLDGGIGHLLKSKGLDDFSETLAYDELFAAGGLANILRPDLVRKVHEDYVQIGNVDVITTNTFGCTKFSLNKLPGNADLATELAVAAAKIAKGVAESCDRKVLVAGKQPFVVFLTAAAAATFYN